MTIEQTVWQVLALNGYPVGNLDESLQQLGMDSLEIVKMIMDVEEELGIEVDAADLRSIQTVRDLVKLIEGCKK